VTERAQLEGYQLMDVLSKHHCRQELRRRPKILLELTFDLGLWLRCYPQEECGDITTLIC
jgi:hypothetical protein